MNTIDLRGPVVDDTTAVMFEYCGIPCISSEQIRNILNEAGSNEINITINSNGGSVTAATDIFALLKNSKNHINIDIYGIAASAASIIAMGANKIRMDSTALMMIHLPITAVNGNQEDMRKTAATLDAVTQTIINAYQSKTAMSKEQIYALLKDTTYMTAEKALSLGFIDEVIQHDNNQQNINNSLYDTENIVDIQTIAKMKMQNEIEEIKKGRIENDI